MDVKYEFPGTIEITLNTEDYRSLKDRGYCMERDGFTPENKTWVRELDHATEPTATIDGDGDLNIWVPHGVLPPFELTRDVIKGGTGSNLDSIVVDYLGPDGTVVLK